MSRAFSSTVSAPRADSTTNYVDWWAVQASPCELISLFGYNSGPQQWIQIFDAVAHTVAVTDSDDSTDIMTAAAHGFATGQRLQLVAGNTLGIAAGIYYAKNISTNTFSLYDTLAHALVGSATGLKDVTVLGGSGTINLMPFNTWGIAALDNFSIIVPSTAIGLGRGLVIANSTTGPLYTAGSKNITILGTLKA